MGFVQTCKRAGTTYYWEGFKQFVKSCTDTCVRCQASKAVCQKPAGLLQSLKMPVRWWASISMDFVTALSLTPEGQDAILVVVDRLSKMAHFLPATTNATAEYVADFFVRQIARLHSVPSSVVPDWDTRFLSAFWETFTNRLQIKRALSTAWHPQSDGYTERTNTTLEQLLRVFIQADQTQWEKLLPALELADNTTLQASTGLSPLQIMRGENPITANDHELFMHYLSPTCAGNFVCG